MIIFVTGPPAAGKTSLAVPLARELGLPLLAKDSIKEAIHDAMPASLSERAWSHHLSEASYRVLLALIAEIPAAVLDLNLPTEWTADFDAVEGTKLQLFCRCPQGELERRLMTRATTRHPTHLDDVVLAEVRAEGVRGSRPAQLTGPLLEVDTTAPVDLAPVLDWVHRATS